MNQQQPTSSAQREHFWQTVQEQLAAIVRDAEAYLPDEDDEALDTETAREIVQSLLSARASSDTAAGAYGRVLRSAHQAPAPVQTEQPWAHLGRRS